MGESMVANFRARQAQEEQAAHQGLSGLAAVASHEAITARMERGAERLIKRVEALVKQGKRDEAQAVLTAYDPEKGVEDE